eukprot:SAG11_NODE_35295_length_267_cov_0.619048_1_plen_42_part_10
MPNSTLGKLTATTLAAPETPCGSATLQDRDDLYVAVGAGLLE